MNNHIFKKEPKHPVMSKHIIGKGRWQEPEIILKSSWDGEEVNGVMATLRKDILARVVDTTDKAIVDAVIDFARSEGFTDVYLIDKTYIMAALESKQANDAEIDNLCAEVEHLKKKSDYLADDNIRMREKINKIYDNIHEIATERDTVIKKNAT